MSTAPIAVGLRFNHRDVLKLDALAALADAGGAHGPRELFVKAAEDARIGEPTIIFCSHVDEARQLAQHFATYDITVPNLEEVSGVRPDPAPTFRTPRG